MPRTALLGLPRMGADRELKFALEDHWADQTSAAALEAVARDLRATNWQHALDAGIDVVPVGDFSLYDHVLDTAFALGAIPERFGGPSAPRTLDVFFAMARGTADARPLEMTKWFDTNYHYLVPELQAGQAFTLDASHWTGPLREAQALTGPAGAVARPVVLGPVSFLLLAKGPDRPLDLLDTLVPVYQQLLRELHAAGATEVQIDEPALALDRTAGDLDAFGAGWRALADAAPGLDLTLATYFAGLDVGGVLERVAELAPAELHLDLVRAPQQLGPALKLLGKTSTRISLGVVDGRNVWITDPDIALEHVDAAVDALGADRVTIAPSCSLLHVPHDASAETGIDPEVRAWLAFAREKQVQLTQLRDAVATGGADRDGLLADARAAVSSRRTSALTNDAAVRDRAGCLAPRDYDRSSPSDVRRAAQRARVRLPELPTTTIGSYPQTGEIRSARRDLRSGAIDQAAYDGFMEAEIGRVIAEQEELGLDMLVHGEPERVDMVEYFGQQLDGFAFSANGWVQSYGSRCVKPPILFGDVSRPEAMTVRWWELAQGKTAKPMKGMLTGPVTILQWSFVRDDQPRSETCTQIALAIQDEVLDLERAGAFAIQVDEAAVREGLPLQAHLRDGYQRWAIDCFRLTVAPVRDDTQIHTHMCYSEFNEMMEHIVRLDADVLSIEASRSDMEVLDAFTAGQPYPNEIGPGVYDIHSPRVPSVDEAERLLELAETRIDRSLLWVNPDCGLKTRSWEDIRPALANMVEATHRRRAAAPVGSDG